MEGYFYDNVPAIQAAMIQVLKDIPQSNSKKSMHVFVAHTTALSLQEHVSNKTELFNNNITSIVELRRTTKPVVTFIPKHRKMQLTPLRLYDDYPVTKQKPVPLPSSDFEAYGFTSYPTRRHT
ncbi:hypothetical protein Trydic_g8966 [Trypoxylus dichotomus]